MELGLLLLLVVLVSSSHFGWGWSLLLWPVLKLKSVRPDVFDLPRLKYVRPDVFCEGWSAQGRSSPRRGSEESEAGRVRDGVHAQGVGVMLK